MQNVDAALPHVLNNLELNIKLFNCPSVGPQTASIILGGCCLFSRSCHFLFLLVISLFFHVHIRASYKRLLPLSHYLKEQQASNPESHMQQCAISQGHRTRPGQRWRGLHSGMVGGKTRQLYSPYPSLPCSYLFHFPLHHLTYGHKLFPPQHEGASHSPSRGVPHPKF